MKIVAVSDLHGNLIKIPNRCDVFVIAGDWSPLYIQQEYAEMIEWIKYSFIPWMSDLKARYIIIIPGNHDFVCVSSRFRRDFDILLKHNELDHKVHFLNDESIIIDGKKFYGTPTTEGIRGWAFSKQYHPSYKFDEDTSILITHQPPMIGDVGYTPIYHKDFGSRLLRDLILNSNIDINICGHIHTGTHAIQPVILNNGKHAEIYNVAILNEEYEVEFKPTIINL